jgi:hypothetical protein
MMVSGRILGTAFVVGALSVSSIEVRAAEPVEYVKVCSTFGQGFFYIPGTDTCLSLGGRVRDEGSGNVCNTRFGSHFVGQAACPTTRREASTFRPVRHCLSAGTTYYASGNARCNLSAGITSTFRDQWGWGIDVGLSGSATIFSPNNAFLRGRDTLAVPPDDQRTLDLDRSSGAVGLIGNAWMSAPNFLPLPQGSNVFLQTGLIWPINSERSQTVTGVNVVPNATVTTTVEDKWGWQVYAGFSTPVSALGIPAIPTFDNLRFRVGGGGTFWNGTVTVSGVDTAGSFFSQKDFTRFEPGLLWGFRGTAGGFIYGLDITHSFPCPEFTTAQSVFPSQTYTGSTGDGVNTTVGISISRQIFGTTRVSRDFN